MLRFLSEYTKSLHCKGKAARGMGGRLEVSWILLLARKARESFLGMEIEKGLRRWAKPQPF